MRQGLWVAVALSVGALVSGCGEQTVASLEFVGVTPAQPQIGQTATVSFRAVDSRGLPMAGATVTFDLQSENPDVILSPDVAVTNKGDGIASTQVTTRTGSVFAVTVVASAGDKQAVSVPFSFAGSVPNGRQFTFQCGSTSGAGSGGVRAIGAFDASRTLIAGVQVRCFAHVADRNGDGISGVNVSFLTEAGAITPTAASAEVGGVVGTAEAVHKTSFPLPLDVEPGVFSWEPNTDAAHTGEYLAPLWMEPYAWSEDPVANFNLTPTLQEPNRIDPLRPFDPAKPLETTMNPRDNLVALIAVTAGEEGFSDDNNNGQYDDGEPFDDLTEPFVDANDNGTWDANERFIDANNNGSWDGKNGKHDANALIWVQERILWTGQPAPQDVVAGARNPRPVMRILSPADPLNINIAHRGTSPEISFIMADPWFNSPAQNGTDDGCSVDSGDLVLVSPSAPGPQGIAFLYGAPLLVEFFLRDAHPPDPTVPPFDQPNGYRGEVRCFFTASQEGGHRTVIEGPTFKGTVL